MFYGYFLILILFFYILLPQMEGNNFLMFFCFNLLGGNRPEVESPEETRDRRKYHPKVIQISSHLVPS